jgi:uncharacterized membrane protein YhaH (DUF805 family)
MKWFIKCLRHYADVSGRARRREYWYFILFNLIFLFLWAFLIAYIAVANGNYDEEDLPWAIHITWMALAGLPLLSVTVRRLHDTGKSGWMALVSLIPFVGGLWLLILMTIDGQTGPNRFGPDPKTTPERFPERAKLTSAGVALIVVSGISLLDYLCAAIFPQLYYINDYRTPLPTLLLGFLNLGVVCAAGILLVRARERVRAVPALWLLLAVAGYRLVTNATSIASILKMDIPAIHLVTRFCHLFFYLLVIIALLIAVLEPRRREMARPWAIGAIIMGFLSIAVWVAAIFWNNGFDIDQLNMLFSLVFPATMISWMVVVWTFSSRILEDAPAEEVDPEAEAERSDMLLTEGVALIHLYRPGRMAGAMIGYDLYLDDRLVWRARNGSRTTLRIDTGGTHTVMAKTEVRREVKLDVSLGHEYYIRCGMKMGAMVGRPDLTLVENAAGKSEFERIS